jgi:hypothetical protein
VDPNFTQMTGKRWLRLTTSDTPFTGSVFIRMIKVPKSQTFNLIYTQKVFKNDRNLFLQLLTSEAQIVKLRQELTDASQKSKSFEEIRKLEKVLLNWRDVHKEARNARIRNRFLLLAARYYLLDPKGLLFEEDEVYQEAVQHRGVLDRAKAYTKLAMSLVKRGSGTHFESHESSDIKPKGAMSPKKTHKSGPITDHRSESPDMAAKQAATTIQVIERLQAPTLTTVHGGPQRLPKAIEDRIQPPKRSMTSQSQRFPKPIERASILRTHTTGLNKVAANSDAPIVPKPRKGITFALENAHHDDLPTHIASQRDFQQQLDVTAALEDLRKPYIFRPQSPPTKPFRQSPMPMSALRLPAAPRQRPGRISRDEGTSSPEPVRDNIPPNLGSTALRLEANRRKKAMKLLQPFFEWRSAVPTTPSTPRASGNDQPNYETNHRSSSVGVNSPGNQISTATHILEILDDNMANAYHTIEEDFAIEPPDYGEIILKSVDDVVGALDSQLAGKGAQALDRQNFWDAKVGILTSVDIILSCFVGSDQRSDLIIRKVWGMVFRICQVSFEDVSLFYLKNSNGDESRSRKRPSRSHTVATSRFTGLDVSSQRLSVRAVRCYSQRGLILGIRPSRWTFHSHRHSNLCSGRLFCSF